MYSWTNSAKIPYMVFQLFAEGFPSQPSPTPNLKEPMNPETLPPSAYRITRTTVCDDGCRPSTRCDSPPD